LKKKKKKNRKFFKKSLDFHQTAKQKIGLIGPIGLIFPAPGCRKKSKNFQKIT
jgi:hypothetical protein